MHHINLYAYLIEKHLNWSPFFKAGEVRRNLNMPKTTFNRYAKQLIELGLIKREKRGEYKIIVQDWWIVIAKHVDRNSFLRERI